MFDWNSKATAISESLVGSDYGVIAQDVQEVMPLAVQERANGTKAVNYEKLVPLLIEAVKELKTEVDDLKSQLNRK